MCAYRMEQWEAGRAISRRRMMTRAMLAGAGAAAGGIGWLTPRAARADGALQRPIADFINAQGQADATQFTPPMPNEFGFNTNANDPEQVFAICDYCGFCDEPALLNGLLGTTTRGSVTERSLGGGWRDVSVILHTTNALTWAINLPADNFNTAPLIYGYRVQDLMANKALPPALADLQLQARFKTQDPVGAPLPDLVQAINLGDSPQIVQPLLIACRATADWVAPDGTTVRCTITETGLIGTAIKNGFKGRLYDAFPAENIEFKVIGS